MIGSLHTQKVINELINHTKISILLERNLTEREKASIRETITRKPFILFEKGKENANFISKEAAAEKMIQETGENFIDFLGENPLRDAFVVQIEKSSLQKISQIKSELEKIKGVYEIAIPQNLVEDIRQNLKKINIVIAGFMSYIIDNYYHTC